jgi:hypothetical protein
MTKAQFVTANSITKPVIKAMTIPTNKLLALLLALRELETPLTTDEQSALTEVAEQLSLNPNAWELFIEPNLLTVIQANPALNQRYQTTLSQLDALEGNIPNDLLPTDAELRQVAPAASQVTTRGFAPVRDDSEFDSNEINNMVMAINILATPNPAETTKKLSRFEKLKQFIGQVFQN